MKKEACIILAVLFIVLISSSVFAFSFSDFFKSLGITGKTTETNQTENQTTPTIKCYSSKDCQVTTQYWCDGSSACQKLAQCLNPGTPQSECSIVDECVNCINVGYLGCKDGQCQKINCYKNEDCGESFTKKYCSGSQACVYESINYCSNPGTIDSYCTGKGGTGCTPCVYGCKDGVCTEGTNPTYPCGQGTDGNPCPCISTPIPKPGCTSSSQYNSNGCLSEYKEICEVSTCKDTDGGIDYYVKGSVMFGDKIAATDACVEKCSMDTKVCEKDGNLREESCVPNPGPNEGTMSTNIYKCPNGCSDGACIRGEKQREEVKCIFKNTQTEQKCYRAEFNWMYCSSYQGSCIVTNLEGYDGEKITWKSSCGGYAYTTLDGNNEQIEFDCSGAGAFCQSKQCSDGSWTKCYVDGSGYCICSACPEIIIKPVCGNGVCESGEGQICKMSAVECEAGKECKSSIGKCYYGCEQDCKDIEGIYAKLNEKFKLQVNQQVKIAEYKNMKILFRDLITSKCEATTTNVQEVKAKLTGYAVASEVPSSGGGEGAIEIIKCPTVGPQAQLEVINPEEEGIKILTLRLNEAKSVYSVSVSFLDYDFASRTGVFIVSNKPLLTCPENCKCDNEGYVLECKTEEKCEEGKLLCPDGICREKCEITSITTECKFGCFYQNKCLPYGLRVSGLYCSIDNDMKMQLTADEKCDNNFECSTNLCIDGNCISSGFIQKIFKWFRGLFGREEVEIVDCGTSSECMENAFKACKPAKISQGGGSQEDGLGGLTIEIIGLEGKKCVLKWTAKMASGKESMTCKFENYSLGTNNIGESLEQNCKGTLTYWLAATPKIMRVGETPAPVQTEVLSFCEKIRETGLKYKCLAMVKKDPSDCEMVDEPATAYCYADVALATGDSTICKKIEDLGHREACKAFVERAKDKCSKWIYADYCYRDVAALIGDTSICDYIKHEGGKIECKAVILNDATLCQNSDNEDCYQMLALLTGDEKVCDELKKRENVEVGSMRLINNLDKEVSKCIKMAKKEITGCLFESGSGIDCDLIPVMAKNPSLCENLKATYQGDISSKDRCYFYAAIRLANLLPPELIVLRN